MQERVEAFAANRQSPPREQSSGVLGGFGVEQVPGEGIMGVSNFAEPTP